MIGVEVKSIISFLLAKSMVEGLSKHKEEDVYQHIFSSGFNKFKSDVVVPCLDMLEKKSKKDSHYMEITKLIRKLL